MRIRRAVFLALLLFIGFVSGAAVAATNMEKVEAFIRRDFAVYVDGKKTDTPVLIYNNRSFLQLADIAKVLGADVRWDEPSKSIYVTPVRYAQPDPEQNPYIDTITMVSAEGYKITYLGKEVPVLAIRTTDYMAGRYFRYSDLKNLNVDLSGVKLAQETRTEELFVSERELAKVWNTQPQITFSYERLLVGKIEKEQLDLIEAHIKMMPEVYKGSKVKDPQNPQIDYSPSQIIVYTIDALPNDEFNVLALEYGFSNMYFKRYWIKMRKDENGKWLMTASTTKDLGPVYTYP